MDNQQFAELLNQVCELEQAVTQLSGIRDMIGRNVEEMKDDSGKAVESMTELVEKNKNIRESVDKVGGHMDEQFQHIENQLDISDEKLNKLIEDKFGSINESLDKKIDAFEESIDQRFGKITDILSKIDKQFSELNGLYSSIVAKQLELDRLIEEVRRQHKETSRWAKLFRISAKEEKDAGGRKKG